MIGPMFLGMLAAFVAYQLVAEFIARREDRRWTVDVREKLPSGAQNSRMAPMNLNASPIVDVVDTAPPTWKGWRPVRVANIIDESPDCRSFRLEPTNGEPLPKFKAGQSILVRMPASEPGNRVSRCYSLSGGPSEPHYRITVKRVEGGKLSNSLHDGLSEGDLLEIQAPRGRFHSQPKHCDEPLVLIAAGIGITPMLSMLLENLEQSPKRKVHLFYQLRRPDNAPFLNLLRQVAAECQGILPVQLHVFFSRPDRMPIQHHDTLGRVDAEQILNRVGTGSGEYMICGPDAFMTSLAENLVVGGVKEDHVHYESFGGKAKGVGAVAVGGETEESDGVASTEFQVAFNDSQSYATWTPRSGSLLDLAEASNVDVESACRTGACGACLCKLRSGTVAYGEEPEHEVGMGEVLMCVAEPSSDVTIETIG